MAQAARLASRLQRELKMLQSDPPPGVSAWPSDGHSLTHLQAQIHGPDGTVYANGIFKLDIQVPDRYPFEPPNIKFITPVYHPNIDNGGRICLDILNLPPKGAWRPSLNLLTLLASIGLLLAEPNPDDGLMGDITAEYKHDRRSFDMKARNWTELYASPDQVTSQSKLPQTFSKAEPNEKNGTVRLHGQEQMQPSSSIENHMISNCSTSSQPIRAGLFLSKRLTLDRGTACLQDTKGATSAFSSQCKVSQVKHSDSLKKTTSFPPNQSEAASLHRKTEAQSLKELAIRELLKGEVALETSNSSICDGKKRRELDKLHTEENLINLCTDLTGEFSDDMATVKSNTALNATLSHVASREVFSEAGICPQPDGFCSTSVPDCPEVLDAESSNCRNLRISGQKCKSDFSAGKENQAPNCCPATTKPKEGHFKHPVAGKELSAEVSGPMEMSINPNSLLSIHATLADNRVGKDRSSSLCLPSRAKSLKLARAKPDTNTLPASTIQQALPEVKQVILAEKKWSRPIVISDDVPTVVVSDSGSDSEFSDDGFTLSLSQRNVCNKRKASSNLR